jgi:hypothetical protein
VKRLMALLGTMTALGLGAETVGAQTMIEVTGDIGGTRSNLTELIGPGVFEPSSLTYGATATVLFGRRGPSGLMIGGEIGYTHMLDYNFVFQGETFQDSVEGFRLMIVTRFWFNEGAWFGEGGAGLARLNGLSGSGAVRDPILTAGAGTLFDLSEQWAIVAKVRGSVVFDQGSPMLIGLLRAGVSYNLGG